MMEKYGTLRIASKSVHLVRIHRDKDFRPAEFMVANCFKVSTFSEDSQDRS